MKKLLPVLLALALVFLFAACGQEAAPAEEEGVGNTDESLVALALEQQFQEAYPDVVEEVVPTEIKVYTPEEIAADEALQSYEINDGDVVFAATYDLKIVEGYEDIMQFTAGSGEVDGDWIRNKSNVGIVRTDGDKLTIDAFGTGW